MIKIDVNYTDYRDDNDPDYPGGKAIDTPSDDSVEGTPYKSDWMNDLNGFRQALFIAAFGSIKGVTNIPDSASYSDSLEAILKLIDNVYRKLIGGVKTDLDTLEKLSMAIGNDPLFVETILGVISDEVTARIDADANHAGLTDPHGATSDSEKGRLILRDSETGRAEIEKPLGDKDITNVEWVKNYIFSIGDYYTQYPDTSTPQERGLPGTWEVWSDRAVLYGLSQAAPPSFVDYYSLVGTTIAANATPVVCYHQAGGDWRLYRFIAQAAAYTVPAELDPVKWTYLQPGIIDERRKCANALTDDDYAIGDRVASGSYQTMYVTEIIVPGGKFWGIEGGFRPTFISGGVQEDRIRDIKGTLNSLIAYVMTETTGALSWEDVSSTPINFNGANPQRGAVVALDVARVVPTGPDFSPGNLSTRLWRRVN
jgi:hypothetical protein